MVHPSWLLCQMTCVTAILYDRSLFKWTVFNHLEVLLPHHGLKVITKIHVFS